MGDLTGATWVKASRSNDSGNCVEVAVNLPGIVAVRDSKDPDGPVLVVGRDEWAAFTEAIKGAQFG